METDYIKEMADYILTIIRSGGQVAWSWGPAVFRPVEYNGMAALRFTVTGMVHKGDVVVAYNRGEDTFEVYCLDRDEKVVSSKNDVHLGELVNAIDGLVENPGSYADYDRQLNKLCADNSITVHMEKSFIDYFVEKKKIDIRGVETIRTCGWGNGAVLIVEYAEFHKRYKPIDLARQYLSEMYGYAPKRLNFNNAHHDRIGCSVLNVYDVGREDFDKYSSLPAVAHSEFDEAENWGSLEFPIHNERQLELSYERRLHEYFH